MPNNNKRCRYKTLVEALVEWNAHHYGLCKRRPRPNAFFLRIHTWRIFRQFRNSVETRKCTVSREVESGIIDAMRAVGIKSDSLDSIYIQLFPSIYRTRVGMHHLWRLSMNILSALF